MRRLVVHDVLYVLAAIFQDQVSSTRVILDKGRNVIDFGANGDIARLAGVVGGDVGLGNGGQGSARHLEVDRVFGARCE